MMLAVISGSAVIDLIITLVIVGLVYFIVDWALKKIALPEPFGKIAMVLMVLLAAVFLINALLGLTSTGPFIRWH